MPWPAVEQTVRELEPMCRALVESADADGRESADGYVDAVKELAAAARKRDDPVDGAGIEPATHGFSVRCSTN